jgi:hypothetical protein
MGRSTTRLALDVRLSVRGATKGDLPMVRNVLLVGSLLAIVMLCGVSSAHADTITDTNVQFTGIVTGSQVTLEIQCLNSAICGNWYLGDVTLKGFTFATGPTLGGAPSGYTVVNGGQNNNAVGNGGGCNGTQGGQAVCWDAPTTLSTKLGSNPIFFTANITDGDASTLHVQATAYDNSAGDQQGGGKVLAVSDDLLGSTPVVPTPEPGALSLFATGLIALGFAVGLRRMLSLSV